jgi:membrane protease YdiL (CAAX protease family)
MAAIPTTQPAAPQQSTPHATLRGLVARYPVTAFLVMAFAFGWTTLLPLLLSQDGLAVLPIELPVTVFQVLASLVGLVLPAFLVAAATDGKAGVRELLRRSLRWRVGVQWYVIALLGMFVAVLVVAIPFVGLVPLHMVVRKWQLLFTVFVPGVLVPFLHTNLPEEIGWTSLQARLQDRHGPLLASVMVAPLFTLIHLPAYFVDGWINAEGTPLAEFPSVLLLVGIVAVLSIFLRLIIMWLYNGTGGSLLIVALFHSAFNMSTGQKLTPAFIPGPEASSLPTLAIVVVAVLVAAFTRGRFAYKPAPA